MRGASSASRQAEQHLRTALQYGYDDIWGHNYLGHTLEQTDRHALAGAEFRICVELWEDNPFVHCNLGDWLARDGQWNAAEQSYLQALSNDMSYYLANLRYAQYLNERGRLGKAMLYVRRALVSAPADGRAAQRSHR